MKKLLFLSLVAVSFSANSQSIKDLLYSGKLKSDSNSVVRKGDDLSTKIDTTTKKPQPAPVVTKSTAAPTGAVSPQGKLENNAEVSSDATNSAPGNAANAGAPTKTNKITKEYTDSLISSLKTEVLTSKKVKSANYFFIVEYEITPEAAVNILSVSVNPENSFLQQQVQERMTYNPPPLAAVTDSNGVAKKVKRKYTFSVTKD